MLNIRRTSDPISVSGVGGVLEVDLVGDVAGFGEVYFNPDCIANILCHHDLAKNKMIKFDHKKNIFIVKLFGRTVHFIRKMNCTFLMTDPLRESYQRRSPCVYKRWQKSNGYIRERRKDELR